MKIASLAFVALAFGACSSSNSVKATDGGTGGATCASPPEVSKTEFCNSCQFPSTANPTKCQENRPVNACCAWVQEPRQEAARATGLHYFSAPNGDTSMNLDCLSAPAQLGPSKVVTLKGFVKLFSSGKDSARVKIEIYKEGPDGALGELVGAPVTTTDDDAQNPPQMPLPIWSTKCCATNCSPADGCKLRSYTYLNVPTETPLIIKTSDATGTGSLWSELYDYNVYIPNPTVDGSNVAQYDPSAVASTDVNTVAAAAGGFTIKSDKGIVAGEVHDCADVRISGAMVDTDQPHEGEMFYFGENEGDPLPDRTRAPQGLGTSKLGLFGALNLPTGVPIRISAVIKKDGKNVLLGTYTLRAFPGAISALSFRGRRPWQK